MAKLIDFPKPTRLPIDLPHKKGWLLEFPPQPEWSAVLPDYLNPFYSDPNGDIA
jgi:hypothetical protein